MTSRATSAGRRSPDRDITAPRHDAHTRISKPRDDRRLGANARPPRRNNQSFEDEQTRQWVAQEDVFVLRQAKKKAVIRVREGRAKPIDWLAVTLSLIDPDRDLLDDDEDDDAQIDVVDPEGVFEGLDAAQLDTLEKDIASYVTLETSRNNQDYWNIMQVICKDRRRKLTPAGPEGRAVSSVSADVDKLLRPKTFEQLEALEKQIKAKLQSKEPIDTDYWEQLLRSLIIWKAKAKLKTICQSVVEARLAALRQQHRDQADAARQRLQHVPTDSMAPSSSQLSPARLDPDSLLKLRPEDKALEQLDEASFLATLSSERATVLRRGGISTRRVATESSAPPVAPKHTVPTDTAASGTQRFAGPSNEDFSQTTKALYERELARGVGEDEEIFTGEESVVTSAAPLWADKYRPRKPKYFNRVQMGYEWNKYNQTHYDHDNPPPKVVQGYKFNIFYPDLIDTTKAPTFRIIREHGRKKGESFAPAGEEDTCVIRFIAGPPYEDIAFRIVDKEWDYSAKRERGFRSSFDKGILQLHFQYKKVYYRK